jgi:hypothetical protein
MALQRVLEEFAVLHDESDILEVIATGPGLKPTIVHSNRRPIFHRFAVRQHVDAFGYALAVAVPDVNIRERRSRWQLVLCQRCAGAGKADDRNCAP